MSQDLSEGEEDKELSALLLELRELRGGGPGEWEPVGNNIAGILRKCNPDASDIVTYQTPGFTDSPYQNESIRMCE